MSDSRYRRDRSPAIPLTRRITGENGRMVIISVRPDTGLVWIDAPQGPTSLRRVDAAKLRVTLGLLTERPVIEE